MITNPEERFYKFCPNCNTDLELKFFDGRNRIVCPHCEFIFWSNAKSAGTVLIHKDHQILMVQRAQEPFKGYWCLPGGYLEYEETPENEAKREAKEEVGIDVNLEKLVGVYQIDNDPRGIHIDIVFSGQTEDTPKPN